MFDNFRFLRLDGRKRPQRRDRAMNLETLEERALLSVSPLPVNIPNNIPAFVASPAPKAAASHVDLVADLTGCAEQTPATLPTVANSYEGYNAHDISRAVAFLEQTDGEGVTNGYKINPNYDVNDPTTWNKYIWEGYLGGITFEEVDGEIRITEVNGYLGGSGSFVGAVDFSGCTALTSMDFTECGNGITSINVSGCTALEGVGFDNCYDLTEVIASGCTSLTYLAGDHCQVTTVDVTGCSALETLLLSGNMVSELDLSDCTSLTSVYCDEIRLTELDVSMCPNLTEVAVGGYYYVAEDWDNPDWIAPEPSYVLERVILPAELTSEFNFGCDGAVNWTDSNGNLLDEYGDCSITPTTSFPIYGEYWYEGERTGLQSVMVVQALPTPTLEVSISASQRISVAVYDADYRTSYLLEYSTSEDFADATSLNLRYGSTEFNDLTPGTKYYFRAKALGSVNQGDSLFSEVKTITAGNPFEICNAYDLAHLQAFLEQTDDEGVTNGFIANPDYDVNDPTTWYGAGLNIAFEEVDGEMRLARIEGSSSFSGAADFSGCTALTVFGFGNCVQEITSVNVSGCTALEYLNFEYCHTLTEVNASGCSSLIQTSSKYAPVTVLNLSGCTSLKELYYTESYLTELDLSDCTALTDFSSPNNRLTELDFSMCSNLTTIIAGGYYYVAEDWDDPDWIAPEPSYVLERVILPAELTSEFNFGCDGAVNWTDSNGNLLDEYGDCSITPTTSFPIYGEYWYEGERTGLQSVMVVQALAAPTLSVNVNGFHSIAATVGGVANASGYVLEYSTSEDFADATSLNVSPGETLVDGLDVDTTYYFRVKALGSEDNGNSLFSAVESATTALTIGDYNAHDLARAQAFLEQTNDEGVTNGLILNENYDVNDPTTWYNNTFRVGVTFEEVDGEMRLTSVDCMNKAVVGAIDFSDCTALTNLGCGDGCIYITTVDVSGCTALQHVALDDDYRLTSVNASGCTSLLDITVKTSSITDLNLSGCTALTTLDCHNSLLAELDVSDCTALTWFASEGSRLTEIDLSMCPDLTELRVGGYYNDGLYFRFDNYADDPDWVEPEPFYVLERVILPAERNSDIWVDTGYTNGVDSLTDSNGAALGNHYDQDVISPTTSFPITAQYWYADECTGLQSFMFVEALTAPTVTVNASGDKAVTATIDGVENASGYLLEYSTSEDFANAASLNVSAGETVVSGLSPDTTYYFRSMALGSEEYGNSLFSAVASATTEPYLGPEIVINGKKVTVNWEDDSPAADSIRYRVEGAARWTTAKLRAGVTTYSFNAQAGSNYEIEVLLNQQEDNVLQGTAIVLDQPKLASNKNALTDDSFEISVTNFAAKNLAANATQAIVTVNGVETVLDIADQQGAAALAGGGQVAFADGAFTFTEMNSNTSYKIQVAFSDGVSVSTVSAALTVKTAKAPYDVPAITSAVAVSDTSVVVEWETAYGKNTETAAQKYTVQYSTDGAKWTNATTAATGNSYTIQRLKGGVEYQVRVFATKTNDFEASEPSDVLFAETLTAPKTTVTKNSITDDSFQIDVTNYENTNLVGATMVTVKSDQFGEAQIELQNGSGSAAFDNGMTVAFENGVVTFANAPSNTQQKIQLCFTKDACTTAWSSALTIKTLKAPYLAPAITSAVAVSDTSVVVEWETAYGKNTETPTQKYTVQYSTDGAKWTNATTAATGNSFTIKNLKGGVEYQVRVLATKTNDFEASEPSDVLNAETLTAPKTTLNRNSITDDSFQINVTNYEDSNLVGATMVTVKSDQFGEAQIELQNGSGSAAFDNGMTVAFENGVVTFANAPSNTQQKIQFCFSKDACTTAWSAALTIKTLKAPFDKPVLTNAEAVSSTSVLVEWAPVYGKNSDVEAQKYTVQYSTDGTRWTNATTSATGTSFTIQRLKPNTQYLVAVIANGTTMFNASQPSESQLVSTAE